MAAGGPPTGTVTFLFTDVVGSTRRWQDDAHAMAGRLARHDREVRAVLELAGGHVFSTMGDGFAAAFSSPQDAVRAANEVIVVARDLLPVRVGLHTGVAEERDGNYFGLAVNRCARLMGVAHGGQVLLSDTTAGLVGTSALCDLGRHQLKDIDVAERIWQLGSGEYGPLRSVELFGSSNLPAELSSLVGRDAEVGRVVAAFNDHRLVTVVGVGGVGKTRLALRVGAELSARFEHGVQLVELAGVSEAGSLVGAICTALRVSPPGGTDPREGLLEALHLRHSLLILDNCEHLLTPVAQLAAELLRRCRGVVLLATSREGLGVAGEQLVPLASLGLPTDKGREMESDAVRLFVERAGEVRPDFAVGDDVETVAAICRRLDGIPLAIELAAVRVASLSLSDLAARLDRQFLSLRGGRGSVERHQTLRAALDWSMGLLEGTEKVVLARLGVFASGFTLAAVAAVCAGTDLESDEVVDALAALVAKSLVLPPRNGRYGLLEPIRQYAEELLGASGDAESTRLRHARWCAQLSDELAEQLQGPDYAVAMGRVVAETDNLLAALTYSIGAREWDIGLRIVTPYVWGTLADEARLHQAMATTLVTELPADLDDERVGIVWALHSADLTALGLHDEAWRAAERSRRGVLPRASRANLYAVSRMSFITEYQPSPDRSEVTRLYDEVLVAARELGNQAELGFTLTMVAIRHSLAGDVERARPLADEAEAIARRLDNPRLWLNVDWALVQCALVDRRDQVQTLALDMLHRSVTTPSCRYFASLAVGFVALGGGLPSAQHLRWQLECLGLHHDSLDWAAINMRVVGALLSLLFWGDPAGAAVLIGWVGERTGGTLPGRYPVRKAAAMLGESYDALAVRGAAMNATEALDFAVDAVGVLLAAHS